MKAFGLEIRRDDGNGVYLSLDQLRLLLGEADLSLEGVLERARDNTARRQTRAKQTTQEALYQEEEAKATYNDAVRAAKEAKDKTMMEVEAKTQQAKQDSDVATATAQVLSAFHISVPNPESQGQ